jgi:hypothetical protein
VLRGWQEAQVAVVEGTGLRVPVGEGAGAWVCRAVDLRVQLLVTATGSSAFQAGIAELFGEWGLPVLPWEQARETPVDLAVSASFGGQLHLIQGKLSVLSHGVGYTKKLAQPGAGSREPTFGLSAEWLLVGGEPFVDGLVLSHPEQVERLRRVCPQAAGAAVLGGDPCFDRMLAARPYRERFRRALGVRSGQRLVVLSSTWNPEGLFGSGGGYDVLPGLLERLAAELPADEYRTAAVLHPNIWYGHGPGQVRAWLDRARRAGLALVDPLHDWRQALMAADLVLGDFGAVSYYAAALGTPVVLAAAGQERLDPEAPLAAFVREAPRLDPHGPLRGQLEEALSAHQPLAGPREFTTSAPGASAGLLRRHFYALMDLPEPGGPALLEPLPLPAYAPALRTAPLHVWTRIRGAEVVIERTAGRRPGRDGGVVHLSVHEDTLDPEALESADLITREGRADDPRFGGPGAWTAEVLRRFPHCRAAAYVTGPDDCTVRVRGHGLFRLSAEGGRGEGGDGGEGGEGRGADPAAYGSSLLAWLGSGAGVPSEEGDGSGRSGGVLRMRTAAGVHRVRVRVEQ